MESLANLAIWAWSWSLVRIVMVLGAVLTAVPVIIVFERKIIGWVQRRPGPNRTGPWGLFQGIADGGKLFFKESIKPAEVDTGLYYLAPFFAIVPALILICILPFAPDGGTFLTLDRLAENPGAQITIAGNHPVGLLVYFGITSLGVYGLVLAGWASNNKYALLGGIRSSAQMVSYELALALSVGGVLMLWRPAAHFINGVPVEYGILNLQGLIVGQLAPETAGVVPTSLAGADINLWHWNIWAQPLAFFIFLVAGFAETNRLPFDLPEAESELTGGYHTEYSSMKFAMFFLAEYIHMIIISAMMATLFLGGWSNPFGQGASDVLFMGLHVGFAVDLIFFALKIAAFLFFFIFIRATLPRLRYDQLMTWGWKFMLPLAIANIAVTGTVRLVCDSLALAPWTITVTLLAINVAVIALFELRSMRATPLSTERRQGFSYVT